MLIDEFLPEYDENEIHRIEINAPVERVFAAVQQLDITEARFSMILFRLRGISTRKGDSGRIDIDNFLEMGFVRLAERENEELVLGLVGRFWSPLGGIRKIESAEFLEFDLPGFAKVAWNFRLETKGPRVVLSTETRIVCTDASSRWRFRSYWFFVGPFSGLVRRDILRVIKRQSER